MKLHTDNCKHGRRRKRCIITSLFSFPTMFWAVTVKWVEFICKTKQAELDGKLQLLRDFLHDEGMQYFLIQLVVR